MYTHFILRRIFFGAKEEIRGIKGHRKKEIKTRQRIATLERQIGGDWRSGKLGTLDCNLAFDGAKQRSLLRRRSWVLGRFSVISRAVLGASVAALLERQRLLAGLVVGIHGCSVVRRHQSCTTRLVARRLILASSGRGSIGGLGSGSSGSSSIED